MKVDVTDYNGAGNIIHGSFNNEWQDIFATISGMPLHLKASDQRGKQGTPIFDPVGTNQYIKDELVEKGWANNIPIPKQYNFLGTDIDFGKEGMLVEVQFSNYPFLLNNTVRSELFYKSGMNIDGVPMKMAVIIAKAHMFPSSNSTLYYEQAKNQLNELSKNGVFDVPIRLVGLFEDYNTSIPIRFTTYSDPRYSRTVVRQVQTTGIITNSRASGIASIRVD